MSKNDLGYEVREVFLLAVLDHKEMYIHEIWKNFISRKKEHYHAWLLTIFPSRDSLVKTKNRLRTKQYITIRRHIEQGKRAEVIQHLCRPTNAGRNWMRAKEREFVNQATDQLKDQYNSITQSTPHTNADTLEILANILSDLLKA